MNDRRSLEAITKLVATGTDTEHSQAALSELACNMRDFPHPLNELPERDLHIRLYIIVLIRSIREDIGWAGIEGELGMFYDRRKDFSPLVGFEVADILERMYEGKPLEEPYDQVDPPLSTLEALELALCIAGRVNPIGERAEAKLNTIINKFTDVDDEEIQDLAYRVLKSIKEDKWL